MTEVPFHSTRAGRTYYEHTVPKLVEQLTRVADALERLIELHQPNPEKEDPHGHNLDPQEEPNPPHP